MHFVEAVGVYALSDRAMIQCGTELALVQIFIAHSICMVRAAPASPDPMPLN